MASIDIDGYRMWYRERGAGPVAVLVHGFPFDSSLWMDQLSALSDVRRVVAPDLRGFGSSDPIGDPVLTMERHADDLAALADHLDADVVDVVGLSMGGYVALAFAERHVGRLRSLVLVDTKATADDEKARAGRDVTAMKAVVQGRSALASDLMESLLAPRASTTAKARLRTMTEGTRVETIVAALEGMKQRPDRTSVLAGLSVPVAVVVGEHDRLTTVVDAEAMAAAVGADASVVPDAGHLTAIENPEAVTAALRSLWG